MSDILAVGIKGYFQVLDSGEVGGVHLLNGRQLGPDLLLQYLAALVLDGDRGDGRHLQLADVVLKHVAACTANKCFLSSSIELISAVLRQIL